MECSEEEEGMRGWIPVRGKNIMCDTKKTTTCIVNADSRVLSLMRYCL